MKKNKMINRRDFLKKLGIGAVTTAAAMAAGPVWSLTTEEERKGETRLWFDGGLYRYHDISYQPSYGRQGIPFGIWLYAMA